MITGSNSLHLNIDPHVNAALILHRIGNEPTFLQYGDRGLRCWWGAGPESHQAMSINLVPRILRRIRDLSRKIALEGIDFVNYIAVRCCQMDGYSSPLSITGTCTVARRYSMGKGGASRARKSATLSAKSMMPRVAPKVGIEFLHVSLYPLLNTVTTSRQDR